MEIPKTIDKKLVKKHDMAIIKMLIRTLKEIGILYRFKSTDDIIKKCYWSRGYYCAEGEPIYRNISLWTSDVLNLLDYSKRPTDNETRMMIKFKYNTLLLSEVLFKNRIYSQEFISSYLDTIIWCNKHKIFKKFKCDVSKAKPLVEKCSKYLKHFPKRKDVACEVDEIVKKWK